MQKKLITLVLYLSALLPASAQDSAQVPVSLPLPDSVTAFASARYEPHSFLRRLIMGSNYRKEWQASVTLPVFRFSGSGFQIKELGGGMQTKSLHLVDSLGKNWSLRTVDKDVTDALLPALRKTVVHKASQDLISAAYPYGAPVAGELAFAAGVTAARPQVYYVADDSALGEYRPLFAQTFCTLEERDPGFDSTVNSFALLEDLRRNNRSKVVQAQLLKARLLDILMADWDRHADNWRWGWKDSAGLRSYYAIPRDRDWVFYQSKGWLPKLVQWTGGMRCFVNFGPEVKNVKNLSWKAWTLDRFFLNELTAAEWEAGVASLQQDLSDGAIEAAVKKLPAAVYAMDGALFTDILKKRRDGLEKEVMKYYRFLSAEVVIDGTGGDETFRVTSDGNSLTVTVYREGNEKIYERRFSPGETFFITLNGNGGNDVFETTGERKSRIRIRINGGSGTDTYNLQGNLRTAVYDAGESNTVVNEGRAKFFRVADVAARSNTP